MRRMTRTALWALLVGVPASIGWTVASHQMTVASTSRLWIDGTSTVRSFSCQASPVDATVVAKDVGAASQVLAGEKAITSVSVTVPSAKLDCKNGTMNEHMMKALKASEFPTIQFTLGSYELASAESGMTVTMDGTLTLGGVTKPVTVTAKATAGDEGALQVTGQYELNMKDYGLKPPSLMLGTMKVRENVKVNFDLLLKD